MTKSQVNSDTFEGTITTTSNETLEINTSRGDKVLVMIDDGTTGNTPATYDMTQRVFEADIGDYQLYDEVTGETSRSWVDNAWGEKMQFEFNNQSGADATYRITVVVYREG